MQTVLLTLASTFLGFLMTAVGVMLGAYCVFRTKRDSFEPFFTPTAPPEGKAVNLDDGLDGFPTAPIDPRTPQEKIAQDMAAQRFFDEFYKDHQDA